MFVRVWQYRVHHEQIDEFERAYGPEGDWVMLFGRSSGYEGTGLFRDCIDQNVYLTVDRWSAERDWTAFLGRWKTEYQQLDDALAHLTVEDDELLSGSC